MSTHRYSHLLSPIQIGNVIYIDVEGVSHEIACDDVVVSFGCAPMVEEKISVIPPAPAIWQAVPSDIQMGL